MNRIIKFRVWEKEGVVPHGNEWFEGKMHEVKPNHRNSFLDYCLERPNEYIVMQFTGLLDKNGKEIYEDDLVDTGTKKGRVKFLFGCWHFVDGDNAYLLYPKEEGYGRGGKWKWIEVIGNIYENLELIK